MGWLLWLFWCLGFGTWWYCGYGQLELQWKFWWGFDELELWWVLKLQGLEWKLQIGASEFGWMLCDDCQIWNQIGNRNDLELKPFAFCGQLYLVALLLSGFQFYVKVNYPFMISELVDVLWDIYISILNLLIKLTVKILLWIILASLALLFYFRTDCILLSLWYYSHWWSLDNLWTESLICYFVINLTY